MSDKLLCNKTQIYCQNCECQIWKLFDQNRIFVFNLVMTLVYVKNASQVKYTKSLFYVSAQVAPFTVMWLLVRFLNYVYITLLFNPFHFDANYTLLKTMINLIFVYYLINSQCFKWKISLLKNLFWNIWNDYALIYNRQITWHTIFSNEICLQIITSAWIFYSIEGLPMWEYTQCSCNHCNANNEKGNAVPPVEERKRSNKYLDWTRHS